MAYRDIYSKTGYFLLPTITARQYQPRLEIKSSIFGTTEEEEEVGCSMEERDQGIKSTKLLK